jgi:glutathione S-transferase
MLKIWGRVNSINVQKVMWAVGELKLPHERVDAGMAFGVVNTPEYRKMNPNGRVPTIDYDGFVLWESNVIVRYLYAKHGPARTLEQGYSEEKWMTGRRAPSPRRSRPCLQLIRTPAEKRDMPAVEAAITGCRHLQDRRRRARVKALPRRQQLLDGRHPVRLLREPLVRVADPAPRPPEPRPVL